MRARLLVAILLFLIAAIAGYYLAQGNHNYKLTTAIQEGKSDLAVKLIEDGNGNISEVTPDGQTPLILAAINGQTKVLKLIIAKDKSSINVKDKSNRTALQQAIRYTHVEAALALIEAGSDPNIANMDGKTPLIYAAERNLAKLIKPLIEHGAQVNYINAAGQSAITYGISSCNAEIVQTLLDNGANLYITDTFNHSTAEMAMISSAKGCAEFSKWLIDKYDFTKAPQALNKAFIIAAGLNRWDLMEIMLTKGAQIDGQGEFNQTALMNAVDNGHNEVVENLLSRGANVNSADQDGRSMLMRIASKTYPNSKVLVNKLLTAGADINLQDNDGWSALMYAARDGNGECMHLLLANKADTKLKNKTGQTALDIAKSRNRVDVIAQLTKAS